MDKNIKKEKEEQIIELVSQFCKEKLNDEYEQLCIKLTKKLGRERNVPFMTGRINIWASAIAYTVGRVNFLFDKSFEPYIPLKELHEYFGTKNQTVTAKANQICKLLDIYIFDNEFSTQASSERNPLNKVVMIDGLFVPLESLPEEYQKMVKEARANGEDISFTTE